MVEKLGEGFDVHHIDGDHGNNCPLNLVLIEHTDHMALHNGGFYTLGRISRTGASAERRFKKKTALKRYQEDQDKVVTFAKTLRHENG